MRFERQRLKVSLAGGVVVCDCALHGRIQVDECTWTRTAGAACVEDARHAHRAGQDAAEGGGGDEPHGGGDVPITDQLLE